MLNQRGDKLYLDPISWGYDPEWWREMKRQPVINARVETATTSRMFKPIWDYGRALVIADGWCGRAVSAQWDHSGQRSVRRDTAGGMGKCG